MKGDGGKQGIEKQVHDVSIETLSNVGDRDEKKHLSSFMNRFFSLSSSLALTGCKEGVKRRECKATHD